MQGVTVKPARVMDSRAGKAVVFGVPSQIPGIVRLEVTLDRNGNPKGAKYLAGRADLFATAMQTVRKMRFEAAMIDGQPVASTLEVVLNFQFDTRQ